ncbi:MAG: carbamoyltransferase HypF, partial [Leptolyngbya sp. DLM2.Bin15]
METRQVAEDIRVEGIVQGVGFRPTVYRLAEQYELRGWVLNDGAGVWIRIAGAPEQIATFVEELKGSPPPLARITRITRTALPLTAVPERSFSIAASQTGIVQTKISPDAATCASCQRDLQDPDSRFFRYPFTNCTHCGPRLSIIRAIPYDRHQTSMAAFPMCVACERDYQAIANRRFHAQPIACPTCGPQVWLEESDGQILAKGEAAIARTVLLLRQGEIIAIKGLGGIHLACDASQETAVAALRHRKHRPAKPFALMVRDLAQLRDYCHVNEIEQQLLASPAAPIVLLTRRPDRPHHALQALAHPI